MQGYCVKCRAKKEIKDAKNITMKNGKPATKAVCEVCGTTMFKIGKAKQSTNQELSRNARITKRVFLGFTTRS